MNDVICRQAVLDLIAVYEWKAFLSRWSKIIKKTKGEKERQRTLLGLYADIIRADEFIMP